MVEPPRPPASAIVTGDTKVVERGKADGLYINTSGIGVLPHEVGSARARPGRRPGAVSGPIGDHGMAIMIARGELDLEVDLALTPRRCTTWSAACSSGGEGHADARPDPRRRGSRS